MLTYGDMLSRTRVLLALSLSLSAAGVGAQTAAAPPTPTIARPTVVTAARRPAPSRSALVASSPRGEMALRRDLERLVSTSTNRGDWGVVVVSLARRDTLGGVASGPIV